MQLWPMTMRPCPSNQHSAFIEQPGPMLTCSDSKLQRASPQITAPSWTPPRRSSARLTGVGNSVEVAAWPRSSHRQRLARVVRQRGEACPHRVLDYAGGNRSRSGQTCFDAHFDALPNSARRMCRTVNGATAAASTAWVTEVGPADGGQPQLRQQQQGRREQQVPATGLEAGQQPDPLVQPDERPVDDHHGGERSAQPDQPQQRHPFRDVLRSDQFHERAGARHADDHGRGHDPRPQQQAAPEQGARMPVRSGRLDHERGGDVPQHQG